MQTTKLIALIMAAAVMLCTTSARARLISYEGCDYGVTNNVNGLNGGTGWQAGWAWNWGGGARHWQVVEPGLTYADGTTNLAVKGRTLRSPRNPCTATIAPTANHSEDLSVIAYKAAVEAG